MVMGTLICVVDDDVSVRESLPDLLRELGFVAQAFPSAKDLLASESLKSASCLIVDIGMPGMTGPELQQELARRRQGIPIIFITAIVDESIRPGLLAQGASDCLFKPFSDIALLRSINAALGSR